MSNYRNDDMPQNEVETYWPTAVKQLTERAVKAELRVKELDDQLRDLSYTALNLRVEVRQLREHNGELVRVATEAKILLARAFVQLDDEQPVAREVSAAINAFMDRVAGEGTKQEP